MHPALLRLRDIGAYWSLSLHAALSSVVKFMRKSHHLSRFHSEISWLNTGFFKLCILSPKFLRDWKY